MSSPGEQNVSEILARLKSVYHLDNDADLARFLGISSSRLANWKRRSSIPLRLVLTKCEDLNKEWLLTGEGEPFTGRGKAPHGAVASGDFFYGTPDAINRAKSAEQMEAVFKQMDNDTLRRLLVLCGLPEKIAQEYVEMRHKDAVARHATDLMWLRLGYRVERIPT
jgi:hypothetical protein